MEDFSEPLSGYISSHFSTDLLVFFSSNKAEILESATPRVYEVREFLWAFSLI